MCSLVHRLINIVLVGTQRWVLKTMNGRQVTKKSSKKHPELFVILCHLWKGKVWRHLQDDTSANKRGGQEDTGQGEAVRKINLHRIPGLIKSSSTRQSKSYYKYSYHFWFHCSKHLNLYICSSASYLHSFPHRFSPHSQTW